MSVSMIAGHLGEFLQGRLGAGGPLALVTAPCPALGLWGYARAARNGYVHDPQRALPARALAKIQQRLGRPLHARLVLRATMVPGAGCGASTAALLMLIRQIAPALAPMDAMRLCQEIEGASDPLAFDAPERLLWAAREGRGLARLPAMPALRIIGGFRGAPMRTDPADLRFADIGDLVPLWSDACARGDVAALGELATQSFMRHAALRDLPPEPIGEIATQLGALGIMRAHTGSARGIILRHDAPRSQRIAARAALTRAGYARVIGFSSGGRAT